jgi:sterol desaturase/sphingolipid hydroxylase (fatty acid hydroxylase superfamily)
MVSGLFLGFAVFAAIFIPLERALALRRGQPIFRAGWRTDLAHFFLNYFLGRAVVFAVGAAVVLLLHGALNAGLRAAVAAQPQWAQFLEVLCIGDLAGYWGHRMNHRLGWLWRLHAIHHSSARLDWLASARVHPLDQVLGKFLALAPLYVLGFNGASVGGFAVVGVFYALFLHANVRLRFGPLRWLIATPEFHHWHHARERAAWGKNFAALFPWIDLAFGTLYLPRGRMPAGYGIDEPVPGDYPRQLAAPFRRARAQLRAAAPGR